jgi:hypothetical protein
MSPKFGGGGAVMWLVNQNNAEAHQSRTQSNACVRARKALALGK